MSGGSILMNHKIMVGIRDKFPSLANYRHSLFGASSALTVAVLLFGCYRLAAMNWGKEGFSEYAMARRAISFAEAIFNFGIPVTLCKEVAVALLNDKRDTVPLLLFVSSAIICSSGLCLLIVAHFWSELLSVAIFGLPQYSHLATPIVLNVFAIVLHVNVYQFFRGTSRFSMANVLQLLSFGVFPFLSLILFPEDMATAFWWSGGAILGLNSLLAILCLKGLKWPSTTSLAITCRSLIFSGVVRPAANIGWQALISLPSFFATYFLGLEYGGAVAAGTSLVTGLSVPYDGAGLILLPMAASMIEAGRALVLRRKSLLLIIFIFFTGIPLTVLCEIYAELISRIILGFPSDQFILVIRILLPSLVPISVYITLRHIVDGACKAYVNSRNIVLSLIIYNAAIPVARYFVSDPYGLFVSWFLSLIILAALTVGSIWTVTRPRVVS